MEVANPNQALMVNYEPRKSYMTVNMASLKGKKTPGTNINAKSRSGILKATRRLLWDRARQKQSLQNSAEKTAALKIIGQNMGGARKLVAADWAQAAQINNKREDMEAAWKTFLSKTWVANVSGTNTNVSEFVLSALGRDAQGMKKREALVSAGFQRTGGQGKFRPYYIANGVLRGGVSAKGTDNGNAFCIPIIPKGESRVLQSLQAKYTNPMAWPSTRIIRFVRGHWGNAASGDANVRRELVTF